MATATSTPTIFKHAEAVLKRVRKWDTEFCCLGTKKDMFIVPQPDEVMPRISANVDYFRVNYGICVAFMIFVAIVVYPQLLVLVCVFSGLWYGLNMQPDNLKIKVGASTITKRHLTYSLAGLNLLGVVVFARTMILATVGAAFLFVVGHASMHTIPSSYKAQEPPEATPKAMV
eukprot:TRINITY_DN102416_c0_g1_i1.p1 TRINITY_DN102416_c0_g1~~TRINITY_DN102416_c0_g1_i1.p1  ORF type:complete len:202 (-),score=36.58 TRINITY_DN102416_c0_g1_i1:90-608(-)